MRAPLRGRDDIDEALEYGVVAGAPAQGDIDGAFAIEFGRDHRPAVVQHGHRFGETSLALQPPSGGDRRVGREMFDELGDSPVKPEGLPRGSLTTLIADLEAEPGNEKCGLPSPRHQFVGLEFRTAGEDLSICPIPDPGARDAPRDLAHDTQLAAGHERAERRIRSSASRIGESSWLAAVKRHRPGFADPIHFDVKPLRKGIDHRRANAVEPARCRVRPASELAAGVQLREDDFHSAQSGLRFDVDRDAPRMVAHFDTVIGMQDDFDDRAVPTERLVDRVVDDLPQTVHQAPRIGGADVHARAFAHRFEAFEHREVSC